LTASSSPSTAAPQAADGLTNKKCTPHSLMVTDKNADGTEIHQATTTLSIDGNTRSVGTDFDSNATADRINTLLLRDAAKDMCTATVI
jgi:hypothetical protein